MVVHGSFTRVEQTHAVLTQIKIFKCQPLRGGKLKSSLLCGYNNRGSDRKASRIGVGKWSSSICIGKESKKAFRGINDVSISAVK